MYLQANRAQSGYMNQIMPVLVLVITVVAMAVQLVRTLRSDGYGLRPPPRSHRGEVDRTSPYRSLV
ncbi:hypothetical protein AERO9AM_10812 [Aeromicrobium sp. 9AM]|nr:hypothetical protein AERO9AM_10812 [Aeromicrobium sp. 9AM]